MLRSRSPRFKIKNVTPPPKPPAHGGDTAKSVADPSVVVAPPPVSLPSVVVSTTSTSFTIKASSLPTFSSSLPSLAVPAGSGLGQGTTGGGSPQTNPFGGAVDSGATGLVGYFYDLKQTNETPPNPTGMTQALWRTDMLRLVADNLNEEDLSKYLKSSAPLCTYGFDIPEQASTNAPVAFALKNVKPNLWTIIYRGKASVPEAGRYRFVGFGDDLLYIKLNGKEVFDGGCLPMSSDNSLHAVYNSTLWKDLDSWVPRKGAWFNVDQGDVVSLDILIGDWGGKCGFNLFLEKEGESYDQAPDNVMPKLPFFQIGAKLPPPDKNTLPLVSDGGIVWPSASDQL